jgi:ABC-type polysaccharide/polyol phosphate export permease
MFCGYFAWNFMSGTFGSGPRVFISLKKLVQQRIVPLTLLPFVGMVRRSIIFIGIMCGTLIYGIIVGVGPYLTWIQIPVLLALMIVYWYFFTLLTASIGTLSDDFAMFVRILTQPFFWTSGVIFDVSFIQNSIFQVYLKINPFAFFITAFRKTVHDEEWVFADVDLFVPFVCVFIVTAILACITYHKMKLEVRNELRQGAK